jgi:hypothetical protein
MLAMIHAQQLWHCPNDFNVLIDVFGDLHVQEHPKF